MRSEGYGSWVCVCVSVKSHLTSGSSVRPETSVTYSAGNGGQKICRVFSETANRFIQKLWCDLLTYGILQRYCSGILHNFSTAELSKARNKANSRLNATWNMTQCKAVSFFLLCLRLLLTNLPYTLRYTHFISACAFQDSRTRGAEGSVL